MAQCCHTGSGNKPVNEVKVVTLTDGACGAGCENHTYLSCIKGKRLVLEASFSAAANPLLVTTSEHVETGLWLLLRETKDCSLHPFRKICISTSRTRPPARGGTPHQVLENQRGAGTSNA